MSGHDDLPGPHGLPGPLPKGETMLWQGSPRWETVARRVFHLRKLAAYFAVILLFRELYFLSRGDGGPALLVSGLWLVGVAAVAIGLLAGIAWLIARTTVYTITDQRVVMQAGIALQLCINLPFKQIQSAGLKTYADGTGDIPLALPAGEHIAYLALWPHARPWRLSHPDPMLRGIPDAANVARILSRALAAAAALPVAAAPEPEAAAATRRRTAYA
ncbi:MAG: photosynthetic complex putative assembly protein PuhB [Dongiaceae bacterium]